MAKFTVRVELHSAPSTAYTLLHQAMEEHGFARTITSGDGNTYCLPDAEYAFEGDATAKQVVDIAKQAVGSLGELDFGVIVTESKGRTWFGLRKA